MTKFNTLALVRAATLATLVAACDETASEARVVALPDGGAEMLSDAEQPLDGDGGVADAALPPQARTYLMEGEYHCVVAGRRQSTRDYGIPAASAVPDTAVTVTVSGGTWSVTYVPVEGGSNTAPLLTSGYYTGELHAETDVGEYPSTDLTLSAQRSQDANAPDVTLSYVTFLAGTGNYDTYTLSGDCSR